MKSSEDERIQVLLVRVYCRNTTFTDGFGRVKRGLDQIAIPGYNPSTPNYKRPHRTVHYRGGNGIAGDDHEIGNITDIESDIVDTHDPGTSRSGHLDTMFDLGIFSEAVGKRELPGPIEHVPIAIWRPVIAGPVLTETDANTRFLKEA
jgi:hypothetical protein